MAAAPAPAAPVCGTGDMAHSVFAKIARQEVEGQELRRTISEIAALKSSNTYDKLPSVFELSLSKASPQKYPGHRVKVSAGVADPILERARETHAFEDYKYLSDLKPKKLSSKEKQALIARAKRAELKAGRGEAGERAYLKTYIDGAYEHTPDLLPVKGMAPARWRVSTGHESWDRAFDYTEETWGKLLRKTAKDYGDSYLPTPYPVFVPGGRFSEYYNWDMYFAVEGALSTGRLDVAQMQVENLLNSIQRFGFVPNGGRDYYLTRSQPPMLSSMIRNVYEASVQEAHGDAKELARLKRWLKERAEPLIEGEYKNFWMNPSTRYDPTTGLNHHWDSANLPRPERHGADDELALGHTYRDTRAAAESGLDFTDLHQKDASQMGSVLLNSVMGKVEQDLAWMSRETGDATKAQSFEAAFKKRQQAMNKYLWNDKLGRFENYNLRTRKRVAALGADTYAPLWAGVADSKQAARVRVAAKPLEKKGGIMGSELTKSTHQWDGNNGWAPLQYFAIQGLRNYGYSDDAKRIAQKWVNGLAESYAHEGSMFERIDVETLSKPVEDGTKYNPQPDFLWSVATYEWALHDVLGVKLVPLAAKK
jgi:alpha,alpha-trehalase